MITTSHVSDNVFALSRPLLAAAPGIDLATALNWVIFWSVVAIFLVIEGLLLYAAVRFRQRGASDSGAHPAPRRWQPELVWSILPALVTAVILFLTFQAILGNQVQL